MKILAIDYNSLMNRSFFAIRALSTKEGFPTNALLGFTKTYGKLLKTFSPDLVIAAYDVHAPTFRHKMFDGYKGTRSSTPEDLLAQMPLGKEFIALAGGTVLGIEGYEADDILGTIGAYAEQNGHQCIIATGDRDSFQLVSDQVSVNLASNKGDILYTPQTIQEQYGVSPRQLIEVKSLMGDSSDNIPGVKGIGEKTALTLIQKNGSLQNILEHLDEIDATPRVKKLIEEHRNEALLSHTLGEIKKDVPLGIDLASLADKQPDKDGLAIFLTKYELTSVLKSFDLKEKREPDTTPPEISLPEFIYESSPNIESVQKQLEDFGKIYFLWNGGLSLMVSENKIVSFSDGEEAFARLVLNSRCQRSPLTPSRSIGTPSKRAKPCKTLLLT